MTVPADAAGAIRDLPPVVAVTSSGALCGSAEVVEGDPLIRPAASRAAAAFLRECKGIVGVGPPASAGLAVLRFVGVHGLQAVAACPLLRSPAAHRAACGTRSAPTGPVPVHGRRPTFTGPVIRAEERSVVLYTLRDGLSAALHQAHGCADAVAVLVPGDTGDRFAVLAWPPPLEAYGLTVREIDVLALVLARLTNGEIAQRLVVTGATVRAHVRALQRKLGTGDRRAIWRLFGVDAAAFLPVRF